MGVSIYYQARRERLLTAQEAEAIDAISGSNDVADWESFCVYPPDKGTEPGVIFEGATKLPLTTEDEFWAAIQHWCRVLTLIRRVLPDAEWSVHIDDAAVAWNEELEAYDPTIEAENA